MNESERRRNAIVKRLLSLNLSTQHELKDILQLTAAICRTSAVFISLLDKEQQHIPISIGIDKEYTAIEDSICRYTVLQDEIMEIEDIWLDERFSNKDLKVGNKPIRFYAGVPLSTQYGDKLGSLCVVDAEPGALTALQKNCLQSLARQITTILEFESSLGILKEEIEKVHDSEMKLKAIFQSSPDAYVLLDTAYRIKAFNRAAYNLAIQHTNVIITEGLDMRVFIRPEHMADFTETVENVLMGKNLSVTLRLPSLHTGDAWWQIKHHPVYDHNSKIVGVSIDISDITEVIKDKENIVAQNLALKEIAQIQSHELRRPVANIMALADILANKDDEDFHLNLAYLKQEVLHLDEKIHRIVEMSSSYNTIHHAT